MSLYSKTCLKQPLRIVFPPAPQQAKRALLKAQRQALLSPSSNLNVVFSYINVFMPLSIMQLLSVPFKCKIIYLLNYYFRIFKPILGLLFEHTLIIFFLYTPYSNRTVRPSFCPSVPQSVRPSRCRVRSISPILFEVGIPNLVCECILGWRSVVCHFLVTVTLTLTSDLVFRIIMSGAYLLYYLR